MSKSPTVATIAKDKRASTNESLDKMASTTLVPGAAPFLLKAEDVETLAHSDGFNILRNHLAEHYDYGYANQLHRNRRFTCGPNVSTDSVAAIPLRPRKLLSVGW